MSTEINGGGPAFPQPFCDEKGHCIDGFGGMPLRDYFAAKALQGLIANKANPLHFKPDDDAAYCYSLADAMLKARDA